MQGNWGTTLGSVRGNPGAELRVPVISEAFRKVFEKGLLFGTRSLLAGCCRSLRPPVHWPPLPPLRVFWNQVLSTKASRGLCAVPLLLRARRWSSCCSPLGATITQSPLVSSSAPPPGRFLLGQRTTWRVLLSSDALESCMQTWVGSAWTRTMAG
jgi:hypothetical protein